MNKTGKLNRLDKLWGQLFKGKTVVFKLPTFEQMPREKIAFKHKESVHYALNQHFSTTLVL